MSCQKSIVYHFFLLMYDSWRKISKQKVVPLVKTNTKLLYKTSIWRTQNIYDSSKVNCSSFFPLNVQALEKIFLRKSCSIIEN